MRGLSSARTFDPAGTASSPPSVARHLEPFPVSRKYFGEVAATYDERRQSKTAFYDDQSVIMSVLAAHVGPSAKVLDVACGTNRISDFVHKLGGVYYGIDISSDMVAQAKQKDPSADIRVADARNIPHPACTFHFVMTIKFLKWIPDDNALEQVLEEISRVLKPGGLGLLHQKISTGSEPRRGLRFAKAIRSFVKGIRRSKRKYDSVRDPQIKRRAVDEAVFLRLCEHADLRLKQVILTSPTTLIKNNELINAFYVVEKIKCTIYPYL